MIRALAIALVVALIAVGVQTWRLRSEKLDQAEEKANLAETNRLRERAARAEQQALNDRTRKAADVYLARAAAARRADADRDAEYRGLLNALATPGGGAAGDPAAACRADGERSRDLEGLLRESAVLLHEGARHLGRVAAKLDGLQEHIGAVDDGSGAGTAPGVNP